MFAENGLLLAWYAIQVNSWKKKFIVSAFIDQTKQFWTKCLTQKHGLSKISVRALKWMSGKV